MAEMKGYFLWPDKVTNNRYIGKRQTNPIPRYWTGRMVGVSARMSPGLPMLLVTDGLRPKPFFLNTMLYFKPSPSEFMIFRIRSSDKLNIFVDFILLNDHTRLPRVLIGINARGPSVNPEPQGYVIA